MTEYYFGPWTGPVSDSWYEAAERIARRHDARTVRRRVRAPGCAVNPVARCAVSGPAVFGLGDPRLVRLPRTRRALRFRDGPCGAR